MAKIFGEIIATPDEEAPYAVVIAHGDKVLVRVGVSSQSAGEQIVVEVLQTLETFAIKDGRES